MATGQTGGPEDTGDVAVLDCGLPLVNTARQRSYLACACLGELWQK